MFILITQAAGFIGSLATAPSLEWYATLQKPFFAPPTWLFGPVWITLYTLIGISGFLAYQKGRDGKAIMRLFAVQLVLNALWSIIFFGLQSPALAFGEIVLLWGSIVLLISQMNHVSKRAAYLLIPYLVWVMIAATLNAGIWILNI